MRGWLKGFGPAMGRAQPVDLMRAGGGALAGLLAAALVLHVGDGGAALIAPFGASSVLLYAVPNSPLAQPWSAIAGNTLSALVAVVVASVVPQGMWLAPVAVALAIAVMLALRALHPPGGAVALLVAMQPSAGIVATVAIGTLALVGAAILWNLAVGRVYPFRQPSTPGPHGTADPAPQARVGLDPAALATILEDYRQSANLGVADLARLIGAAEEAAAARHMEAFTCADIMSRDLVTVAPEASLIDVAGLFRTHEFTSIPVVRGDGVLAGVILQIDLIRKAGAEALHLHRGFARLVGRGRQRLTAADIMQVAMPRATPTTPVGALLPLMADGGAEAVPVVVDGRIVGIVTRSDLVSALAHRLAETVYARGT
ncbi:HPP family protein [Tabrizicola sp. BL-A-41-H6]|uniref:HPP family protein n=1 Tax=Tabrizicola sp. BL-A-41-H6 TaxID=3421107 RepID=UPI003D670643